MVGFMPTDQRRFQHLGHPNVLCDMENAHVRIIVFLVKGEPDAWVGCHSYFVNTKLFRHPVPETVHLQQASIQNCASRGLVPSPVRAIGQTNAIVLAQQFLLLQYRITQLLMTQW